MVALVAFIVTVIVLIIGSTIWSIMHPPPESGYVLKKNYYQPYWTTQCMSYDDKGYCRSSVPLYHDARYCLYLQDDQDKEKKGDRCVDQNTYEKYDVGSHYPDAR